MSKFRIVKTTAANVYNNYTLYVSDIDPFEERFIVQKKKLFGWESLSVQWSLEDAEEEILRVKGIHPDQLARKEAREKPNEIMGEY